MGLPCWVAFFSALKEPMNSSQHMFLSNTSTIRQYPIAPRVYYLSVCLKVLWPSSSNDAVNMVHTSIKGSLSPRATPNVCISE